MSHSKSLFLGPHLPDECMKVLDCVFFSSNELKNLACGDGGEKKEVLSLCVFVDLRACARTGLSVCALNYTPAVCHESFH